MYVNTMVKKKRVIAYFDGSNFYHYCKAAYGITSVDFKLMTEQMLHLDKEKVVRILYFTAPVNQQEDSLGYRAQQRFLSHVRKTALTEVHLGKLVKRSLNRIHIECPKCGHQEASELKCPKCQREINVRNCFKLTEKGVDVRLAMAMLLDALDNKYDKALLFSSDADFSPTAKYLVKSLKKEVVYCRFPGQATNELLQTCSEDRIITKEAVEAARPS